MTDVRNQLVLVVDDTPANLHVAAGVLRPHYKVLAATDGEKALQALDKRPEVDLVLLDVMMPGIDGFETCRRIKANPATAHIPVIFLTALSDEADRTKAVDAGGIDFISKPFDPVGLLARVDAQLA